MIYDRHGLLEQAERLGYVENKDEENGFVGVEKRILPE